MSKDTPVHSEHIDTLRVTLPIEDYYAVALCEVCKPTKPRDGYTRAVTTDDGLQWMCNPDRPDMGCSVLLDGDTCQKLRADARFATIARWLAERPGARCSRIDLAFDVFDREPLDLAHASVRAGAFVSRAGRKSYQFVEGGDGSLTVYMGKRSSESFLRIYDKAKEQKLPGEWTRFELECKGNRAHPTLLLWLDGVTPRAIIADFVKFVDERSESVTNNRNMRRLEASYWWTRLMGAAVRCCVYAEKIPKNLTRKLLWFEKFMLSSAIEYSQQVECLQENINQWMQKSLSPLYVAAS